MSARREKQLNAEEDNFTRGLALGLAEIHRLTGADSPVKEAASHCGLTLASAKDAGVDGYDLRALRKAGVKRGRRK